MDTQVEVPNFKLAKVGNKREKKRGGGGWLGARGASSGFSGAVGGSGAGGAGALMSGGMTLGKLLAVLLISGGLSASAWKVGHLMAASSADVKPAASKVFADKNAGKYADLSGVVKNDKSIPNSLGYINNDGLTDEQRAAKKAADDAAAAKAASDAQAKADADAKTKALADQTAASATPDAAPAGPPAPEAVKKGLLGAGKFGSLSSGTGGGGGLSGGAGLSGGINGKFAGMGGLGDKAKSGAISGFRNATKVGSSGATPASHGHSNAKGFAKQQLDQAFGQSRSALATGKSESASAGAGAPFDNNAAQGSVISGPGLGSGTQAGRADGSVGTNQGGGGGGPLGGGGGAACSDANYQPDQNGNCTLTTNAPPGKDAAPYQGMIDAIMIMLLAIALISVIAWVADKTYYGKTIATVLAWCIVAMGAAIAAMGIAIATMKHGDFMIGAILGVVGTYIAASAYTSISTDEWGESVVSTEGAAHVLIASAIGMLAGGSKMGASLG